MGNVFGRHIEEQTRHRGGSTPALECSICKGDYVSPRALPCGHIFCENCIQQWGDRQPLDEEGLLVLSCPNCRREWLMAFRAAELPRIFAVQHLVDAINAGDARIINSEQLKEAATQTSPPKRTLSIVLVGETGQCKTATLNTLLGRYAFTCSSTQNSTTQHVSYDTVEFDKFSVTIFDTPGLGAEKKLSDETLSFLRREWREAEPDLAAICFVFRYGHKDTIQATLIESLKHLLGVEQIEKHCFLLITGVDDMHRQNVTADAYLTELSDTLGKFVNRLSGRAIFVNNLFVPRPPRPCPGLDATWTGPQEWNNALSEEQVKEMQAGLSAERERILTKVITNLERQAYDFAWLPAPDRVAALKQQVANFDDAWERAAVFFVEPSVGSVGSLEPTSLVLEIAAMAERLENGKLWINGALAAFTTVCIGGGVLLIVANVVTGGAATPFTIAAAAATGAGTASIITTTIADILVDRSRTADARRHFEAFMRTTAARDEAITLYNEFAATNMPQIALLGCDGKPDYAGHALNAASLLPLAFGAALRFGDDIAASVAKMSFTMISQSVRTICLVIAPFGIVSDTVMLGRLLKKLLDPERREKLPEQLRRDVRRVIAEVMKTDALVKHGIMTAERAAARIQRIERLQSLDGYEWLAERTDVPDPPTNVKIKRGENSAEFSWQPPAYIGGAEIIEYEIKSKSRFSPKLTKWTPVQRGISLTSWILPMAPKKGTQYRLYAYNERGRSCGSLAAADA